MHKLKVEGHEGLYRDPQSNAIINENDHEYTQYLKRRAAMAANKNRLQTQEQELQNVKEELSEIKEMLLSLLKGKT